MQDGGVVTVAMISRDACKISIPHNSVPSDFLSHVPQATQCILHGSISLNMRFMLPGYSLEPKPNMPDLAAIFVFHGTAGTIITIGFVTEGTLALE